MDLQTAEQVIREGSRRYWPEYQKLIDVAAFNDDGGMRFNSMCGCIRGVTLAVTLHTFHQLPTCNCMHYWDTGEMVGIEEFEEAYFVLGYDTPMLYTESIFIDETLPDDPFGPRDILRQQRLAVILHDEIRLRASEMHYTVEEHVEMELVPVGRGSH